MPYSSLPAAWLEVNDSGSSLANPPVHLQFASSWLPELRSLLLGGNSITATGYAVLQTVANWRSLQTLDLSDNALTGSVEDVLILYYYCDGSGGTGCGGNISSVAAPLLRVLKLDGNNLTGEKEEFNDSTTVCQACPARTREQFVFPVSPLLGGNAEMHRTVK